MKILLAVFALFYGVSLPEVASEDTPMGFSNTMEAVDLSTTGECQTAAAAANNGTLPSSFTSLTPGTVHTLGHDTFASILGGASYTFVLFYDPNDVSNKLDKQLGILSVITRDANLRAHLGATTISFAKLDIRRHAYLRRIYSPRGTYHGVGGHYHDFYTNYATVQSNRQWIMNSTTFMALDRDALPTFPSRWVLFSNETSYNVVDCIDDFLVDDTSYYNLLGWLKQTIDNRGRKHPTTFQTPISREMSDKYFYQQKKPLESIDWDAADKLASQLKLEGTSKKKRSTGNMFSINQDEQGESFYKYNPLDLDTVDNKNNAKVMDAIGPLIATYLMFADSYENLWDSERKEREDAHTNYGFYLDRMNGQMRDLLLSHFPNMESADDVPIALLERYFQDMVFGYGRSSSSLQKYLETHVYNKDSNGTERIELFQRIRDYMSVQELVGQSGSRYDEYLKKLWMKLKAILVQFQAGLSRHYTRYIQNHPEMENDTRYSFTPLDVIDMSDPSNYELLSNYEAFESRYVKPRTPVILSNVQLTSQNYTKEYLIEKCGFVNVTRSVSKSFDVGDVVRAWGGLKEYELPQELMMKSRKKDDSWDRSLSLEQFFALIERFDNLYLHDYSLFSNCASLLWEDSPYDPSEKQHFRIPSVFGGYDLFQKLPTSTFANTWPSLFVGRKGTNSKIHIDTGATGFWMFLVSGKKRWTVYDVAERPFLYKHLGSEPFAADVLALNSTSTADKREAVHDYFDATYPLLRRPCAERKAYEIVQQPGQLVYIPPNTPHAVENMEDIVGVSFNQVPRSAVADHLFELIHDKNAFASLEIALRYLTWENDAHISFCNHSDPLYVTLGEYIAQA